MLALDLGSDVAYLDDHWFLICSILCIHTVGLPLRFINTILECLVWNLQVRRDIAILLEHLMCVVEVRVDLLGQNRVWIVAVTIESLVGDLVWQVRAAEGRSLILYLAI